MVAFQPHMVSRTRIFGHDMGVALGAADEVVVMDVYVAREAPETGVSGALVADAVPLGAEHVVFEPSWSATAAQRLFALHPLFFSFIGSASWVSNIESEPNENVVLPIWNGRKLRPGRLVDGQDQGKKSVPSFSQLAFSEKRENLEDGRCCSPA